MQSTGTGRRRKPTNNTGVTRDRVVAAATILSREQGLHRWPLRTLLDELDTSASVVYRLVGDRDALCAAVVERVLGAVELPADDVDWQDWLRRMLVAFRAVASGCPGTARWLMLKGGTTPPVVEAMVRGIRVLDVAGFADEASLALSHAVTATMNLVAIRDERRLADVADGPVDHDRIARELHRLGGPTLNGLSGLARAFDVGRGEDELFDYVLDRVLDGLAARLDVLSDGPAPTPPVSRE